MRLIVALGLAAGLAAAARAQSASSVRLDGLWESKQRLGPDLRGTLWVERTTLGWRASIAGRSSDARVTHDSVAFEIPGGTFRGRVDEATRRVVGQWVQSRTLENQAAYASPLTLTPCGAECWRASVVPLDETLTFHLKVTRRPDGALAAFLRNPERNLGERFLPVARVEQDGAAVRFLDRRDSVVGTGVLRDEVLSVAFARAPGWFDFLRVPDTTFTTFYPRGRPTMRYRYVPPRATDDGWRVGTLDEVGISRDSITALIQRIVNTPHDSIGQPETHALLIARHGRLVLEEYFFGENAERPHDSRSAAKTVVSMLVGASMRAGLPVSPETSAYAVLRPRAANLSPRKQAITLDHLLTMTSGLDCDDNGADRPGNENTVQQQSNPDWYSVILDLDVVREPGTSAVYCSIQTHLAGGVLAGATRRALPDLMWELLGRPLDMQRYYMWLAPLGEAYMGGGMRFLARDFAKLAQLYLDGGTWRGRRIVDRAWIDRAISTPTHQWWVREYPYRGRTIKGYAAFGNGAQFSMFIPELDLVIAAFGGNYAGAGAGALINRIVPQAILPAVDATPK